MIPQLCAAYCPGHRQAAEEQHDCVQRAQCRIQIFVSINKNFRVVAAIDGVSHEQTAEEQNFCYQKQPHPQLARIELLLSALKMVRNSLVGVMVLFGGWRN